MDLSSVTGPFSGGALAVLVKLLAAAAAGLILGFDREIKGHAAGLRTHAIVAIAAATTAILSLDLYKELRAAYPDTNADPLRIVEGLVAAVGFIGGGLIIRMGGQIRGLTTAANLWVCGIIGLAFGAGLFKIGFLALGLSFVILVGLKIVEDRFLPDRDGEEPP